MSGSRVDRDDASAIIVPARAESNAALGGVFGVHSARDDTQLAVELQSHRGAAAVERGVDDDSADTPRPVIGEGDVFRSDDEHTRLSHNASMTTRYGTHRRI